MGICRRQLSLFHPLHTPFLLANSNQTSPRRRGSFSCRHTPESKGGEGAQLSTGTVKDGMDAVKSGDAEVETPSWLE
jgi:hypothetical protein